MTGVEARAVLEGSNYPPGQRFALYRIAEIVNEKNNWEWWQKNADLADEIGTTRQTVSGWMKEFVADGWIEPVDAGDGRFGKATRYRFARRFSVSPEPTPSVGKPDSECHETRHLVSSEPTRKRERTRERSLEREPPISPFDEWWAEYPKKVSKGTAKKAYAKALKTVDSARLLEAVRDYRDHDRRVADGFVMNPATWLNGECWNDEVQRATKKSVYEETGDLVAQVFARRQPQQKEIGP